MNTISATCRMTENAIPISGSSRTRVQSAPTIPLALGNRAGNARSRSFRSRHMSLIFTMGGPEMAPQSRLDGPVEGRGHAPDLRDHLREAIGLERLRAVGECFRGSRMHLDDQAVGARGHARHGHRLHVFP